jgi:hypothetical protein
MIYFAGLFIVVVVLVLLINAREQQRRDEAWQAFAAARQLGWSRGQIAGVVSGFTVALLTEMRGEGKGRHRVAVARCSLADVFSPSFALEREGFGDKVLQLVRGPDHQLGDPALDSAFLLHNVDERARAVLADRGAREALLDCVSRYPSMRIGNGTLQLELQKVPSDEATLSSFLQDAVSLATTLQRAQRRG